jgi:hypothetical protein
MTRPLNCGRFKLAYSGRSENKRSRGDRIGTCDLFVPNPAPCVALLSLAGGSWTKPNALPIVGPLLYFAAVPSSCPPVVLANP